jgi:ElaA protein
MQRGLSWVQEHHGAVPITLCAQAHLERFYGELGFVRTSANFDEDGIPHLKMRRTSI